jgi:hypothetical protein
MTQPEEDRSKLIYYLYGNEDHQAKLNFLGTLQGTSFNSHEKITTKRDPNINVIAMSKKGKNSYPGKSRIKNITKHTYRNGLKEGLVGYSYHYE